MRQYTSHIVMKNRVTTVFVYQDRNPVHLRAIVISDFMGVCVIWKWKVSERSIVKFQYSNTEDPIIFRVNSILEHDELVYRI